MCTKLPDSNLFVTYQYIYNHTYKSNEHHKRALLKDKEHFRSKFACGSSACSTSETCNYYYQSPRAIHQKYSNMIIVHQRIIEFLSPHRNQNRSVKNVFHPLNLAFSIHIQKEQILTGKIQSKGTEDQ